jgi:hypothetical protein
MKSLAGSFVMILPAFLKTLSVRGVARQFKESI